jgi:hypothetical protein
MSWARGRWAGSDIKIFAACAALAAAALLLPAPGRSDPGLRLAGRLLTSTCLLRTVTGIECPFCGLSRSLVALAHGRLAESASFHPLGPGVAVFLVLQLFYRGVRLVRGPDWLAPDRTPTAIRLAPWYLLLAGFVIVWGIRIATAVLGWL